MKVVIIGGGASGLISGIYASKNNDVTILEKNEKLGKKILVTGNGRCNYFNSDMNIENYHSKNIELLNQIINKQNINEILSLFDKLGIIPNIKDGYYYPYSNQAVSIQNTLSKEVENLNIKLNTEVLSVEYKDKFIIKTNNGNYEADKLIVSTGSNIGSNGIGYDIAKCFKHSIIDVKPALVGLVGKANYYKGWNGIRATVKLSYNKKEETGEIQLTNYGISGICVMNLSSQILEEIENNNILNINFIPFLNINSLEEFKEFLNKRNNNLKNRNISELLDGFLNYKLVNILLKLSNINNQEKLRNIKNIDMLYDNLTNFKFEVKESNGFNNAQTCSGGIPLTEINLSTMESLKQKNLYFTGELLDADGKCGGYNLAFAFITGFIAGSNLND